MKVHVGKIGWVWRMMGVGILLVLMQTPISHLQPFYDSVNAVVGDKSYLNAFGKLPDQTVSEHVRIQTHLTYVDALLRKQSMAHLRPEKRKQRLALLEHLRIYRDAGIFPQRQDRYAKRRPCFIDDTGNICAVGYLIEQTAGRDLAEQINAQYQYAYLWNMQNDDLNVWVDESGFSLKELAMIQPTYQGLRYLCILVPNGSTPCTVDFEDFVTFARAFNASYGDINYDSVADTNQDHIINFMDFIAFAGQFGRKGVCYQVSGNVLQSGSGLAGVTLRFAELNERWDTLTDSLGAYSMPEVPWGNFSIVPQKVGYVFSPDTLRVDIRDDIVEQNFEAIPIQPLLTEHVSNRN